MNSSSYNLQLVHGTPIERSKNGDNLRDSAHPIDEEFNTNLDLLSVKFQRSIEINQPSRVKSSDQSYVLLGYPNDTKTEAALKEAKNKSKSELGSCSGLDLELKLSPPELSSDNLYPLKSSSSLISSSSSSSSKGTSMSSNLDSNENSDDSSNKESPQLIVMGCTICHMYVMVSDAAPKCPRCKNVNMLDLFRGNLSNKR